MEAIFDSFSRIIEALGGPAAFGAAIGIPDSHARAMKTRDSIPPEYWPATVRTAETKGIAGVTADAMAKIAARKAGRLPEEVAS
jgi:hypothetical protein